MEDGQRGSELTFLDSLPGFRLEVHTSQGHSVLLQIRNGPCGGMPWASARKTKTIIYDVTEELLVSTTSSYNLFWKIPIFGRLDTVRGLKTCKRCRRVQSGGGGLLLCWIQGSHKTWTMNGTWETAEPRPTEIWNIWRSWGSLQMVLSNHIQMEVRKNFIQCTFSWEKEKKIIIKNDEMWAQS